MDFHNDGAAFKLLAGASHVYRGLRMCTAAAKYVKGGFIYVKELRIDEANRRSRPQINEGGFKYVKVPSNI